MGRAHSVDDYLEAIYFLATPIGEYGPIVGESPVPAARVAARPQLGKVEFMLPHSRAEYRWFLALSATAGVCEELLYRGYLTWFLSPWLGVGGAFAAVVALFGIGHAYQGRRGAVRATVAGAVMSAVVLLTGWLLPAMIIHAMVDASSGTAGYWLLRESGHSGSGAESRTGEETSPRAEMAAEAV